MRKERLPERSSYTSSLPVHQPVRLAPFQATSTKQNTCCFLLHQTDKAATGPWEHWGGCGAARRHEENWKYYWRYRKYPGVLRQVYVGTYGTWGTLWERTQLTGKKEPQPSVTAHTITWFISMMMNYSSSLTVAHRMLLPHIRTKTCEHYHLFPGNSCLHLYHFSFGELLVILLAHFSKCASPFYFGKTVTSAITFWTKYWIPK